MSAVFDQAQEFDCVVCGSTHIPSGNKEGLCSACWEEFVRWADRVKAPNRSRNAINKWMARRLMMDATRLARNGLTGRCEAAASAGRGWIDGHDLQCRNRAITTRDGRRVCEKHANATAPVFVGSVAHDPYQDMQRTMTTLARTDKKFRAALKAALQTCK